MPHPLVTETHLRVETMDSKFTSIQVGCQLHEDVHAMWKDETRVSAASQL